MFEDLSKRILVRPQRNFVSALARYLDQDYYDDKRLGSIRYYYQRLAAIALARASIDDPEIVRKVTSVAQRLALPLELYPYLLAHKNKHYQVPWVLEEYRAHYSPKMLQGDN